MDDHTEAMRLADHAMALSNEGPMIHAVSWTQINGTLELCANTIRQKSARIAELEARVHTCGPTCSKAGCINRRLAAERDTLRAEVERLRVDADRWHVANLTAETAWKHPDHRSQEENTAFIAYRCAVKDGLNFEGAVDAAVAAIDTARKATP